MLSDWAATLVAEDLRVWGMTASVTSTVELPGTHVRQMAGLNRPHSICLRDALSQDLGDIR